MILKDSEQKQNSLSLLNSLPLEEGVEKSINLENNSEFFAYSSLPDIPYNVPLLLKGFGSGHGVGMSQWGAKSMAERGSSFRAILRHYYRNTRVANFSSS